MIPFRLHRRIPLIRRPFFQRDRALAERNAARSEVRDLAQALEEMRAERDRYRAEITGQPRNASDQFTLGPGFQSFPIVGDGNARVQIVVESKNRSAYDQSIFEERAYGDVARLFLNLLRGEGTLIDVGANIGTICLPVAASGVRVIAIEMNPQNIIKLTLATLVNRFPRFRVVHAAATESEAMVGYIGEAAWGRISEAPDARQAVGLRLDSILDMIELDTPWFLRSPVAMKIDIEGHELAAMRGAEQFLQKHRPVIVFESIQGAGDEPGKAQAVKQLVCGYGYSLHVIHGNILSPCQPDDDQISLVSDILAIPDEAAEFVSNRLSGHQMRPLSFVEQFAWLRAIASDGDLHRKHAITMAARMRQQFPNAATELDFFRDSLARECT